MEATKQEGKLGVEEVMRLIKEISATNAEGQKQFAKDLAFLINNPEPTEEEKKRNLENARQMAENARVAEEAKKYRRENCPHRRIGSQWGMFQGTSVIWWQYTNPTYKDEKGFGHDGPTVAIGVCNWCQSEFKPGDPDYAQALSWGVSPVAETHNMNRNLGIWV